jgi:hypothetical protein
MRTIIPQRVYLVNIPSGGCAVLLAYYETMEPPALNSRDLMIVLYALHMTLVSIDIGLWFRNNRLTRGENSEGAAAPRFSRRRTER